MAKLARFPTHCDFSALTGHYGQEYRNPRAECITDINSFSALSPNATKILTRLCGDIENESVRGSGRAAAPELAWWHQYLDATLCGLDISGPDIDKKILTAANVDHNFMVAKAEVASNNLLATSVLFSWPA
jgi:hypothetical protein